MNYYFITGTSSGIGKALVERLITYVNNKVIGLSRTNTIHEDQFEHHIIDLSKTEETSNFKFPTLESADKICLINNAGTLGDIEYVGNLTSENIIDAMQVNFTSVAVLTNNFIKAYKKNNAEKIIFNISSGAANSAYDGWSGYCSAKAALNMYTQVVAKEQQNAINPVKIYAIAPGVVDTVMQSEIRKTDKDKFHDKDKFVNLKEKGQLYKAYDVANILVAYLNDTNEIPSLISRIRL